MSERTTRISRQFAAPAAVVYRALTDAEAVKAWRFPDGMSIRVHEFNPREGGRFRVSLTYHDPSGVGKTQHDTDTYHGFFEQLLDGRKVVEVLEFETDDPASAGEMRITYELSEREGVTTLVAIHENVPPGVRLEDNEMGWSMALQKLAAWVEVQPGRASLSARIGP